MTNRRTRKQKSPAPTPKTIEPTLFATAKTSWSQFHEFQRELIRLHVWILTAVSLLQPYAVGFFGPSGSLPQDPWAFYLAVLKTTAPLTIALTVWVVLLVACWPQNDETSYFMLMALIGALMLTVAAKIGNAFGGNHVELIEPFQIASPINGLVNALASYLTAYRGAMFISSLGIAGYAGFICYRCCRRLATSTHKNTDDSEPNDRLAA